MNVARCVSGRFPQLMTLFVACEGSFSGFSAFRLSDFLKISAVLEAGSYPFPFRTRKSSLRSLMVPGLRARESRSPPDPRGPFPNGRGPLFVFKAAHGGALLPFCDFCRCL